MQCETPVLKLGSLVQFEPCREALRRHQVLLSHLHLVPDLAYTVRKELINRSGFLLRSKSPQEKKRLGFSDIIQSAAPQSATKQARGSLPGPAASKGGCVASCVLGVGGQGWQDQVSVHTRM